MKRLKRLKISELLNDARQEWNDLRIINDGKKHSAEEIRKHAEKIANEYLKASGSGSWSVFGTELMAAIFTALGPEEINWEPKWKEMIEEGRHEFDDQAIFVLEWLHENGKLEFGTRLAGLFEKIEGEEKKSFYLSVYLSAKLLKEEAVK